MLTDGRPLTSSPLPAQGRSAFAARLVAAGPFLSRAFGFTAGGFLLVDTLLALAFTDFDLAVGDDLPRETWTFFFAFNTWHHLLHLVTATLLLVTALKRAWAPLGALAFGAVYVVLTPLGFLDGDDAFNVIYSSWRENWVHAMLAVQGVGLGVMGLHALRCEGPREE